MQMHLRGGPNGVGDGVTSEVVSGEGVREGESDRIWDGERKISVEEVGRKEEIVAAEDIVCDDVRSNTTLDVGVDNSSSIVSVVKQE